MQAKGTFNLVWCFILGNYESSNVPTKSVRNFPSSFVLIVSVPHGDRSKSKITFGQ